MKCFFAFVFLVFYTSHCSGGTFSQNGSLPYVPGECFFNKRYHSPGEHNLPGCTRLICSPKGWASVHSCIESSKEGCVRGDQIDIDKPFPECCKRPYTCKHGDGSEYTITDF